MTKPTLSFSISHDTDIKAGDHVINNRMELLKVDSTEPRDNGNVKYWFTNGMYGLKDETLLGAPESFYIKVSIEKCPDIK